MFQDIFWGIAVISDTV